jgi:hypothetical protein
VNYFKNTQQIDFATDHGKSYVHREKNSPYFLSKRKARDLVAMICRWETVVVNMVDRDMLTRVWNEMNFPIDVYRVTKGGHSEHP